MQKTLLAIGISMATLVSCSKNDERTAEEKRLTRRLWKVTNLTTPKDSDPSKDSSIMLTCNNDDILTFQWNGDVSISDGASTCAASAIKYGNGKWQLNTKRDSLILSGTGSFEPSRWFIQELTDTSFRIRFVRNARTFRITMKNK